MKKLLLVFLLLPFLFLQTTSPCTDLPGSGGCITFITYTPIEIATSTTTPTLAATETLTSTTVPNVTNTHTPTLTTTSIPIVTATLNKNTPLLFPFVEHANSAVTGSIGTSWAFPGYALTASTYRFYAQYLQGRHVLSATWVVAWNPTSGTVPTGVRLVKFDNGPLNIIEITSILMSNTLTPIGSGADVTSQIQTILDDGQFKQLGEQTIGNGTNGCLIYSSVLYIILE